MIAIYRIRGDKTAILFEPNNPDEKAEHISYKELHKRVCKFANVLKENGIKKGDRVCIYLPMIPELAVSVLACARIGAVHSVVFAGFSSTALSTRINDCEAKMVITSDGSFRGAKTIDLKGIVDEALNDCECIEYCISRKRINSDIKMKEGRDKWLQPLLENASDVCSRNNGCRRSFIYFIYFWINRKPERNVTYHSRLYDLYSIYI